MGLDLTLGAVVLIAAFRGWLRGFVSQAVRIGGFVACFYLADPVRDQARPYVLARLPKVDPALMDRILWWASAAASYIVVVGVVTLALKMARRPDATGKVDLRRDNQFAGFLLGTAKGVLTAIFLVAAVEKYAQDLGGRVEWANRMTVDSKALAWNRKYEPAPKIWDSPPVRRFVEHIQRNGLGKLPAEPVLTDAPAGQVAEAILPEPERITPRLEIPGDPAPQASSNLDIDPEVLVDLERFKAERDARRSRRPDPDWR
ncbi:CvpA family protein [Paludisphaera mucosa]|uniref:CvpA family protein n=1 Tax=Paludisphaera mucosa TaxID=3030827 RepID=A0ABT6FFM8_9BACT|nr:CvpA family protein [Paludisphaera mucosa]MDG3006380.1 CvpA family protein [Paludisphaera mucosa]